MKNAQDIKDIVKDKYAQIASKSNQSQKLSCCGTTNTSCCGSDETEYSVFNDDYTKLDGYVADADLSLGCGVPTEYAGIKSGHTVVDLGSGAGNDVFVARSIVGEQGKVVGIDMTEQMISKAVENNHKLGFKNVEFRLGDIEKLPLNESETDVVISNCVLNLVPDKQKAFEEIYRILKPGAHFCVSDIVIKGKLNEKLRKSAELYAGCVSGALEEEEYLSIIKSTGFKNIEMKKKKEIHLPLDLLKQYLSDNEINQLRDDQFGIFSITVVGYK